MSGKVNLDRWGPHLRAAKQAGMSLTQYAAEHGLSRHTLYAARQMLKASARIGRGASAVGAQSSPAFSEMRLVAQPIAALALPRASGPNLRARLPNGIALELSCEGAHATLVRALIDALAGQR